MQQVSKNFEVLGLVCTRILTCFLQIRESTPLSSLMTDNRFGIDRLFFGRFEVAWQIHSCWKVIHRLRHLLFPFVQTTGSTFDVIFSIGSPCPTTSYRSIGVDAWRIILVHFLNKHIAPLHPIARRLITRSQHNKWRMAAILVDDSLTFFQKIFVDGHALSQFYTMIGPRRSFGLQIKTNLVGSYKCGFGWTIWMEPHCIEAIFLALRKDAFPRFYIGRRITSFRKAAVADSASYLHHFVIEQDVSSFNAYLSHTESDRNGVTMIT